MVCMDRPQTDPARQAAGAILERLDELSDAVTQSVWDGVPSYSSVLLGRDDLHGYVRNNLFVVFTSLHEGTTVNEEDLGRARDLGESRALQGVPAEALLRSFRAAERAVVEQFTRFYAMFADDFAGQRAGVSRILASLDRVEVAALEAYRETQVRLVLDDGHATADLVSRLASGAEVSAEDLHRLAQHLRVEPGQPVIAVAARLAHQRDQHASGQVRHHLTARLLEVAQRPVLTGAVHQTMLFLVPVGGAGRRVVGQALGRALAPNQCRYEVVAGTGPTAASLARSGASCRAAMDAMETGLRMGRLRTAVDYDAALVDVLLGHDQPVSERLVELALGPIQGQEHLLSTLATYFAADLSTPETARRLVVHQNTVVYRLRRVKELTGLDVRQVDDLVLLRLALRAKEIHGRESGH